MRISTVALAGSPNSGKTALFNALTGSRQKVANYPGVTVEKKEGTVKTLSGRNIKVIDLPGTYSLNAHSPDEMITRDILLEKYSDLDYSLDAIVAVVDSTQLERNLAFVLELRRLNKPIVLALNMMDIAKARGFEIDLELLEKELEVPVVPMVAIKKLGIQEIIQKLEDFDLTKSQAKEFQDLSVKERFAEVDRLLSVCIKKPGIDSVWTNRIDSFVLHPFWGSVTLLVLLTAIFQAVFTWAAPFQDMVETGVSQLGILVTQVLPEGPLRSLLLDGVIAGVGGVLVFIPQILFLFLFVLILEDCGYMARAAFLLDKLMSKVGLHGRAFVPLLSSFACSIPGIMATRTIQNPRDRLITILISPLMTCSARLPVYSLLIAAFIANTPVLGPLRLQGLVMLGLYVVAVVFGVLVALVFKKTLFKGPTPVFLLEMPSYKFPNLRNLLIGLYERARLFVKRAGTVILSLTVVLWFLASYPKDAAEKSIAEGKPPVYETYAGQIGRAIQPVLAPIGFDWRASIALIPGMAAREVMVGALSTVYAIEQTDDEEALAQSLSERISHDWTLASALSLLCWYIFAPQCLSTLAVARRETNSWRYPALMFGYLFALAYIFAFLTYQIATALGG